MFLLTSRAIHTIVKTMKNKLKVYLDTSVISALFDTRNPERQRLTRGFFDQISRFSVYISVITLAEVEKTPDEELREKMEEILMGHWVLSLTDDVNFLLREYIKHDAVPGKQEEDAVHIAVAVSNGIDYLLSWNFKHMVRDKTRHVVNSVNRANKIKEIEIITPEKILKEVLP